MGESLGCGTPTKNWPNGVPCRFPLKTNQKKERCRFSQPSIRWHLPWHFPGGLRQATFKGLVGVYVAVHIAGSPRKSSGSESGLLFSGKRRSGFGRGFWGRFFGLDFVQANAFALFLGGHLPYPSFLTLHLAQRAEVIFFISVAAFAEYSLLEPSWPSAAWRNLPPFRPPRLRRAGILQRTEL